MANNIDVKIVIDNKQAVQSLQKIEQNTEKFGKSISKNVSKASQAFSVFAGNIASRGLIAGISGIKDIATDLFNVFIVDGVKAAQVQEDAINKLNVALKGSGKFTEEASTSIQEFASELQQSTKFGDEVILQNAALIQSLGRLDTEGLKKATAASADLSAALGIDLATASNLVGRAATGNISLFSRYGVTISKGATNAETFANALEQINKNFGGAAAGQVATFSGATAQLSNTFGDLTEEVGFSVTKNETLISLINNLQKIIGGFSTFIANNRKEFDSWVTQGINIAIDAIVDLLDVADSLSRGFVIAFEGARGAINAFVAGAILPLATLEDAFNGLVSRIPILGEKLGGESSVINNIFESFSESAAESFGKVADAIDNETVFKKVSDGVVKLQNTVRAETAKTTEFLKENNQKVVAVEQEKFDLLNAIREEQKLKEEENKLAAEIIGDESNVKALEKLKENLAAQSALKKQFSQQDTAIAKKLAETEIAEKKKVEENAKGSIFATRKFEDKSNKERLDGLRSSFGQIATLQQSSNKTLFAIGKAAAISTATVDGILATQKALTVAPPPFNFAIAALVGAATAVNVAKIASTSPPAFQSGGVVGGFNGATPGSDNAIATVRTGEMILNSSQQRELFDIANGGGNAQSNAIEIRGTQEINLNVDGRTLATIVRDQIEQGFQLAPA